MHSTFQKMNDFHLNALEGIDLLYAKRRLSLDYLLVHLAIVSCPKKAMIESRTAGQLTKSEAYFCVVKWISSAGTWNAPPTSFWLDHNLIGELTAKICTMKKPGSNESSPLDPVQHPVLLTRPKWTGIPGKTDLSQDLAHLEYRLN